MSFVNFTQGTQLVFSMTDRNVGSSSTAKQSLESLVQGPNRCKYFNRPLDSNLNLSDTILPTFTQEDAYLVEPFVTEPQEYEKPCLQYVAVATQTDFRESEAQTYPWDPPFIVRQANEPEVLSIKKLCFGKGLPATFLEVENISRTRNNKKLRAEYSLSHDKCAYLKRKELIREEVKNEWDYKLSKLNQKQNEKLRLMENTLSEELIKFSDRNDRLLKSIWTKKKVQSSRYCSKMQHKLHKENCELERMDNLIEERRCFKSLNKKEDVRQFPKHTYCGKQKLIDQVDNLFTSFYLTDVDGLSEIEKWLEEEQNMVLKTEIAMPKRAGRKTNMQKLTEKAYQDILVTKRTKLPPKIYHLEFDRQDLTLPPVVHQGFERVDLSSETIDPVTVLQKTLRGRAYQKEVLEVIDRNKAGLSIIFSYQTPEDDTPTLQKVATTNTDLENNSD